MSDQDFLLGATDLLKLGLGAVLTLLTQWALQWAQRRGERIEALTLLDTISQDATRDVGHEEKFRHKDAWAKELAEFATAYRKQLPDLHVPLMKVAWQIESSSFSHDQDDATEYCCDELLADIRSLQLQVLQELIASRRRKDSWSKARIKTRARSLVAEMINDRDGMRISRQHEEPDVRIDDYLKLWISGEDVTKKFRGERAIGSGKGERSESGNSPAA